MPGKLSRFARLALLPAAFFGAGMVSCDPCAGVVSCVTSPRVAVQGTIVDVNSGHGIPGVRVSLARTDDGSHESSSAITDAQGNYQMEVSSESGTFDVTVDSRSGDAYTVRGLSLASTTRKGGGHVLGTWVTAPVFVTPLELVVRETGQLVTTGTVSFQRTGGVAISGPGVVDGVSTTEIVGGRAALLSGVIAADADDVIGDLTVTSPGSSFGTTVIPDVHVRPSYVFRPRDVLRLAVGPELAWILTIYDRATVEGLAGTTVSFRRTGGIETIPESFAGTTNDAGQVLFPLVPQARGTVIGDLTVEPPAPFHSYVIKGLALPTFNTDGVRYWPSFGAGPHLPWVGVVQCQGQPLKGARVTVVRVGGIVATPDKVVETSDANGIFSLNFKPADYGDLIVDLEITPPSGSGCVGYVQHALHLSTLDFDSGSRFRASWNLPTR